MVKIILPLAATAVIGVGAGVGYAYTYGGAGTGHKDEVQHVSTPTGDAVKEATTPKAAAHIDPPVSKPEQPPAGRPEPPVGSPNVPPSAPAVSNATVTSYMASANYDVTSCTYMQSFEKANYTAQSNGFELPSSVPWEAFTCTSAHASYFVVYEQINAQWVPTNTVQT